MPNTRWFGWTYADDNEEPYFEKEENFKVAQDSSLFATYNTALNVVIPPSSVTWSGVRLQWNADFEIPLIAIGYSAYIQFAPDGVSRYVDLNDGDRLYCVVPNTASTNLFLNFKVASGAVTERDGFMTIGFRRGARFCANWSTVM
jgi:hypothetical protein